MSIKLRYFAKNSGLCDLNGLAATGSGL